MTIGVILHPYGEKKPGGLARTIFEWTKALLEIDPKNQYIIFLKDEPLAKPDFPGSNWRVEVLGGGLFWKDKLKKAPRADVYIFQTPALPLFCRLKNSVIITQDFPYKYLPPENLGQRLKNFLIFLYHRFSLRRADLVVAVSQSSKDDTVKFFGISPKKIKVVHMGYKNICAVSEIAVEVPARFFLFVGVVKARKNFFNIVRGFELFKRNHPQLPHKLVVAGKTGNQYFQSIGEYIKKQKLGRDIVFLEYLNDGQLSHVYRRTEALIFPSLVESFGFPNLEAISCGVPVITTKYQGPPEIVGEAGILVDPYNFTEIAEAMEQITTDVRFRQHLVEAGLKRAQNFSWQKAAAGLLGAVETLNYDEK